ncbi:heavy-metal-associated domain-containing protein [Psychromarinibacter sp. C21-152]|uniref:Heavy-metal-associated domain-containing protein n=1 Tax=Psychromarinibacter sediminicola TaxID=3033385 RepID=A0AAE3NWT0_9RHOB|nr:heavy-metal-associated domain-containing protein [Psychromarinibacter sediminicola]MDF0603451.1 heavy-metal-associated domain-containing protein [Psychromarinibacter sediminicola]
MDFKVPEMSCGHCTAAIETSVKAADPAASVACDLGARRVRIDSALTPEELAAAIKAAGYDAQPVAA